MKLPGDLASGTSGSMHCIIQDSDADKAIGIAKMGDIYKNASLNIAAGVKGDNSGGCFNRQSDSTLPGTTHLLFESTNTTRSGTTPAVILSNLDKHTATPSSLLDVVPLAKRGWIYQKRIFSPRILYFTDKRLIWECRSAYWMEDMILIQDSGPMAGIILQDIKLDYSTSDWAIHLADHWYQNIIGEGYTSRTFSKPEDRIIAVVGLAKMWVHRMQDVYLTGHWEGTLASSLAWMRNLGSRTGGGEPHGPS